jgi:hypothetical protein
MMKKTLMTAALLALTSLAGHAHEGVKPRFGGVVASASDLAFELVSTPQGAAIYIEDHGKPLVCFNSRRLASEFDEPSTARWPLGLRARGRAFGVEGLSFVASPNSCWLAEHAQACLDHVFARMGYDRRS